jgi:hypothetical protein
MSKGATSERVLILADGLIYGFQKREGAVVYRVQAPCKCSYSIGSYAIPYVLAQDATTRYIRRGPHGQGIALDGARRWVIPSVDDMRLLGGALLRDENLGHDVAFARARDGSAIWTLHGGNGDVSQCARAAPVPW